MYTKEAFEQRWKVLIGVILVAAIVILNAGLYGIVQKLITDPKITSLSSSLQANIQLVESGFDTYMWSQWFGKNATFMMSIFGAIIGCGLVSGEVSKGTIFFLLSKPISRVAIYGAKFITGTGGLLVIAVTGSLAMLICAYVTGHQITSLGGLILSTILIWLCGVFVMGIAMVFSVVFSDIIKPLVLALAVSLIIAIPSLIPNWDAWSLYTYWESLDVYLGHAFPAKALIVTLIAAIIPFIIGLPLFQKKEF